MFQAFERFVLHGTAHSHYISSDCSVDPSLTGWDVYGIISNGLRL